MSIAWNRARPKKFMRMRGRTRYTTSSRGAPGSPSVPAISVAIRSVGGNFIVNGPELDAPPASRNGADGGLDAFNASFSVIEAHLFHRFPPYGGSVDQAGGGGGARSRAMRAKICPNSNVSIEPFPVAFEFASSASFIQYRTDVAGPLWEGMENEPTHVKRAAFKAIENAMQFYRVSSGHYRLVNHAYCIAGRVSEAS